MEVGVGGHAVVDNQCSTAWFTGACRFLADTDILLLTWCVYLYSGINVYNPLYEFGQI
jgi:hypothetical protein